MSHPLARITAGPVDAPTLVLLHGITASALSQTDAIDHWTALGYRVVAVDARGHGLSPRWAPQELERAGEVLVDDAVAVLEDLLVQDRGRRALGLPATDPPVVIGHSMGAATAMVVAARRPELLTGVVLADPARYGSRSPAELLARGAARERARAAELADPPAAVRRALADAEIPDSEAVVGVWAGQRMDPALLRTGVVAPEAEWAETMAALAVPALLVTGDRPGARGARGTGGREANREPARDDGTRAGGRPRRAAQSTRRVLRRRRSLAGRPPAVNDQSRA